jgi:prepilin-type N-terminal cleavage/methylation domain-containing protein
LGFCFPLFVALFFSKSVIIMKSQRKEVSMRRLAFTMIELVFVIVILGVLAVVALPRFIGVQDDAQIAVEKSGIGAVRSALQAVRAKAIAKARRDFNISVIDKNGLFYSVNYPANTLVAANQESEGDFSVSNYPNALSVGAWSVGGASVDSATPVTAQFASYDGDEKKGSTALAIALEPNGRDDFSTFGTPPHSGYTPSAVSGGTISYITGRATKLVIDPNADPCFGKFWVYNSVSGSIFIAGACVQ